VAVLIGQTAQLLLAPPPKICNQSW